MTQNTDTTERQADYTYHVPASLLREQLAKIEAANERAARQGISSRYTYSTEEYLDYRKERWVRVDVYGSALRYGDWTFVATVDWTTGEPLLRTHPGVPEGTVLPRPTTSECEHCHTARQRKDTYLVQHADGTVRQVGTQCLATYTGIKPGWVSTTEDGPGEYTYAADSYVPTYRPEWLVALASAWVDVHGYVSSRAAVATGKWATKACMTDMLHLPESKLEPEHRAALEAAGTEEYQSKAAAMVAWVAEQKDASDYMVNLQTLCRADHVTDRHVGYLCSVPAAYERTQQRDRERKVAREAAAPVATGKVTVEGTVVSVKWMESEYGAQLKMTVACDNGSRVWVTVPRALWDAVPTSDDLLERRVRFDATVTAAGNDPSFGFGKRPTKAQLLAS